MSYLNTFSIENLEKYNPIFKGLNTPVSGFQSDSRKIKQGDIFIALKGHSVDGFLYALQAENLGAVCIISDSDFAKKHQDGLTIPVVYDQNIQSWLPQAIKDLSNITATLIGVTGTNGKTSITHYIAQAINLIQNKNNCNVIGTAGNGDVTQLTTSVNTTPDILDFYDFVLGYQKDHEFIAVEASSHGIALNRIKNVDFQVKVFSNITQDHLDFHKDFKEYFEIKSKWFFEGVNAKVINVDDPRLRALKLKYQHLTNIISYGLKRDADVCAKNIQYSTKNIAFDLIINQNEIGRYTIELIGDFNLSNVLACIAVLVSLEFSILDIVLVLNQIKSVSGRMQKIENTENSVVVDYAHTPDALEKSLKALSLQKTGKLICLFGCGGDRDKGKRAKMAKVAQDLSDQIFITNDNPRFEKPEDIIGDILEGLDENGKNKSSVILDRKQAIEAAILAMSNGDVLLVAGKGHEDYQLVKNKKLPFSDVEVVTHYLNEVSHDTY
ncbi:MAG: UDP-N-acetylmuramoyl-L-alanyl-D-glutamate--2,6-diaminopimelate ligase [Saccharospirillaceae bacterium]|nr:UDP-N-acetylmuramoyl-L-alanyl-D-glutamate--2,6-diaminopimelate ligase [Pseudomonadales bacterium]NRB78191.1 UDP-N-acetylmuramoyl-L-alanyl-D-glutamate--2,6-diaminopimelate ligase [Saccharospirillaceae bacterium]